jgi:putative membrane protein
MRCTTSQEQRMARTTKNLRLSALSLCLGLAGLGLATGAAAQTATQPAAAAATAKSIPADDKSFAEHAAIGGMAEVEMGKLAQQKAGSDQVKQFGQRMVDDHSKANEELKQVASAKGLTLPSDLDAKHKSKLEKLQKLSGAQFDKAYMDDMVADHKKDVSDFEKEAKAGKDSDVKGFASKTLPTLQEHLKLAESTHAAVKSGGKSAMGTSKGTGG